MKIITVDNFDRESVEQKLVADHIENEVLGQVMLHALQETSHRGDNWYKLVSDDYRLWRGMADLVGDFTIDDFVDQEIGIPDDLDRQVEEFFVKESG